MYSLCIYAKRARTSWINGGSVRTVASYILAAAQCSARYRVFQVIEFWIYNDLSESRESLEARSLRQASSKGDAAARISFARWRIMVMGRDSHTHGPCVRS